ncbi:MAG: dihydrolipoyl dehydrogenase [Ectothiorhodospiraceae bacterium]|nr:dihydrolipoyl dehydrogenase [Ectothiorhodospiraceae bacterium]
MNTRRVDVAIIGAGTAGLNARRQVEKAGAQPLLIESGPYGTTCARVGCMPSKLLIAASDAAHEVADASRFGIEVGAVEVDGAAVLERVRRERDRFAGFVVDATEGLPDTQRLRGHARFVGPTTLMVGEHTRVEARSVVIASGSTPVIPPPFDTLDRHVMVNDDVFELRDLPASVAVIGTGVIGLELGQALARLGVRVTLFNPFDQLGPFSDPRIVEASRAVLTSELDIQLQSRVLEARADERGVTMRWQDRDGATHEARFEKVLAAAGRRPNLAALEPEQAGLPLDGRGRPQQWNPRTTQWGDAPVFIAGDASGHIPLLHEAADEGRIAGANAVTYPDVSTHERRVPLAIAFTDPQMAIVGTPYRDLDLDAVEIGEVSFDDQGRARVMGRNRGAARLYARRACCTLLGAELLGPRVEHMAHLLAWAVQMQMPVQRILEMPFYHPVLEEGLRTALLDLAERLKVTGQCRCEDLAEAPGA